MSQIPVMIDKEVVELLDLDGKQLERSILEDIVVGMYRRHDISARRAASLLSMEFMSFLRWTGEMGIPYIDMTPEEWEEELRVVAELAETRARSR
jgi:predicted HTH domain antitoxin